MAWKRDSRGHFSRAQQKSMLAMRGRGMSIREIAEIAGCGNVTVWSTIRKLQGLPPRSQTLDAKRELYGKLYGAGATPQIATQPGVGKTVDMTQAIAGFAAKAKAISDVLSPVVPAAVAAVTPSSSREAYLQWALTGALGRVGERNFIDQLLADLRDGKLG